MTDKPMVCHQSSNSSS